MRRTLWMLIVLLAAPVVILLLAHAGFAAEAPRPEVAPEVVRWGFMAAAVAAGASALGAAYAVAVVGGAAIGALAEKPEVAGRALVFVGLAEGIAIYGLIVAIMILGRI